VVVVTSSLDARQLAELERLSQPVEAMTEPKLLRVVLYGDPGSAKTTTALHLVKSKGIHVTTDSAWVVVYKYPEIVPKMTRVPFEGFSQLRLICQAKAAGVEPWASYDTLIWDTVSASVDLSLRNLVNAKKFKDQIDPDAESWTHYRLVERKLRETVDSLNKSDFNVIYLAHVRIPGDADKARQQFAVRPSMPEACYKILAQETSMVGLCHRDPKDKVRRIQLDGDLRTTAKSQISTIPEATYELSEIPALIQKWRDQ
jgi:AAA domain